jgi:hypothetical protein
MSMAALTHNGKPVVHRKMDSVWPPRSEEAADQILKDWEMWPAFLSSRHDLRNTQIPAFDYYCQRFSDTFSLLLGIPFTRPAVGGRRLSGCEEAFFLCVLHGMEYLGGKIDMEADKD